MAKKKSKLNHKFFKQGEYTINEVYENIIKPILTNDKTIKIGIVKTSCSILRDHLEKTDIDINYLESFKYSMLNPDIDFALELIKKDKSIAYLFSHIVNYQKEKQSILQQNIDVLEIMNEKKYILGLINV